MNEALSQSAGERFAPDLEVRGSSSGSAQPDAMPATRKVMSTFPAGVAIVAASTAAGPVRLTVSTISRLLLGPPFLLSTVAHGPRTWPSIHNHGAFCISPPAQDQALIAAPFARSRCHRSAGVRWHPSSWLATPTIEGALACLGPPLGSRHPGRDHSVVVSLLINVNCRRPSRCGPTLSYRHHFRVVGHPMSTTGAT